MTLQEKLNIMMIYGYSILFPTRYSIHVVLWKMIELTIIQWTQLELPDPKPSPRSGFQFFFDGDKSIHLYGGYCKIYTKGQKTRGLVHQDFWILRMGDGSPESLSSIRWERRRKAGGFVPSLRSGCTMVYYKSRAVLFGGVSDLEESEETIESVCHSDAYQYSLDNNKWFPLSVRPPKALAKARQNAAENSGLADIKPRAPGARFNSMMAVTKKTLYIYGGILEQGSKETTLSDMWCLNLDKPYEWKCLLEDDISAAEWLGEESDEEDEEDEEEEEEDDSSSSDTEQAEEQDELSEQIQSVSLDASDTDSDDEEFISSIPVPDPIPTENLREYFLRTSTDWQLRAIEWFEEQETQSLQQSGKGIKSLRRDAFTMAQSRYNKLLPELEAMRAKLKEEEAELEMATKKTKGKEQELGTSRHRDR